MLRRKLILVIQDNHLIFNNVHGISYFHAYVLNFHWDSLLGKEILVLLRMQGFFVEFCLCSKMLNNVMIYKTLNFVPVKTKSITFFFKKILSFLNDQMYFRNEKSLSIQERTSTYLAAIKVIFFPQSDFMGQGTTEPIHAPCNFFPVASQYFDVKYIQPTSRSRFFHSR